LLSRRLEAATEWQKKNPATKSLPVGYFGASTGDAAALIAAAQFPEAVRTVVSRGGRPDLAEKLLQKVKVPVLFIVGRKDTTVLELNKKALEQIPADKKLKIVPGATHLFEEPGKLEEVAKLSAEWFLTHLRQTSA
jgi:putative phosphoribosyl transferase